MEAAAVILYFLLEHNYSLVTCILLGYDLNSCTRNKFQQRQYCARVMHFSAFHYNCMRFPFYILVREVPVILSFQVRILHRTSQKTATVMKGTKVHNPRAILSLLKFVSSA